MGIIVACCPALRVLLIKAGEIYGSGSGRGRSMHGTGMRRQTKDMESLSAVDVFPLVQVGTGNEIIKQIDFHVTVDSEVPEQKDKKSSAW